MDIAAEVSRVERKFVLKRGVAESLYGKLRKILPGDEFQGYKPYLVRSLYFDSYFDDDYFDKLDGIRDRKKIRIRIYSPEDQNAKLELKQKQGENQHKVSLSISREQAIRMAGGDYRFLCEEDFGAGQDLAMELYYIMTKELYRPRCIINYQRRAFAVPVNSIRITFDSHIETSEGNFDLFSPLPSLCYPADTETQLVLEVKYNHFLLSYVKDALQLQDMTEGSFSKYVAGRRYGLDDA